MNLLQEKTYSDAQYLSSPRVKMRMLQQMAEALDDEAAGLYRRAAAFEEEEFLLNREIEDRQTEINRLQLKLSALRSERDGLLQKIDSLRTEATAIREEVYNNEDEIALATINGADTTGETLADTLSNVIERESKGQSREPIYFHRLTLTSYAS